MKVKNRNVCLFMSLCIAAMLKGQTSKDPANVNWSDYGGGVDAMAYSPLQQINKTNVNQLVQAGFFSVPGTSARVDYSPWPVDGKMYVLGKGDEIVCLDAATGTEIWSLPTTGTPI